MASVLDWEIATPPLQLSFFSRLSAGALGIGGGVHTLLTLAAPCDPPLGG